MATVTGYTAARMKQIEDSAIVDGDVIGDDLILTRFNAAQINAGNVRGPQGIQGPAGPVPEALIDGNTYARKDGLWVPARGTEVVTSTTRPVSPTTGMMIYETDTKKFYTWNGTVWTLPKNVSEGILGTLGKATADQTGITGETNLNNMSTVLSVGAGRQVKVSFQIQTNRTVVDGITCIRLKEGTTVLCEYYYTNTFANTSESRTGFVLLTPTAVAHTYFLSLLRLSGTGTVGITAGPNWPSSILAEDIGGV